MTLTSVEAEEIVDACIRSAVGWDGLISGGNKLSQVGVVDDDAIDALIDELVTNNSVGVPSKQHQIDPESLDLATGTTVAQTQVQVIENSEAVQAAAKAAKAGAKKAGGGLAAPAKSAVTAKSSVRAGASKKKATKSGKGAAEKKDAQRRTSKGGKRAAKKSTAKKSAGRKSGPQAIGRGKGARKSGTDRARKGGAKRAGKAGAARRGKKR